MIAGWFVFLILMVGLTAVGCALVFNNLGTYNIGGVPNSWSSKVLTVAYLIALVYFWYKLFAVAPFSIDINLPR